MIGTWDLEVFPLGNGANIGYRAYPGVPHTILDTTNATPQLHMHTACTHYVKILAYCRMTSRQPSDSEVST